MTILTRALAAALAILALAGCSSIPTDPDGTLEQVRSSGVLRVGASPAADAVVVDGDTVTGPEAELATSFADKLGAKVEWHPGGEQELVAAMEAGEIDLLIGGLGKDSPWSDKIALTRAYTEGKSHGEKIERVLAVPMGENATLVALEEHLDEVTK